jgi:WD40 repeat protein
LIELVLKYWQDGTFEEVYSAQVAHPSEITSLAFDAASNHLAVTNREGIVQLYDVEATMKLRNVFSVMLPQDIPRAVAFGQMDLGNRNLLIFGLHHGNIHTLSASDGAITNTLAMNTMM